MSEIHNDLFEQKEDADFESKEHRPSIENRLAAFTQRQERIRKSLSRDEDVTKLLDSVEVKVSDLFNELENFTPTEARVYAYTAYEVQNKLSELMSVIRMEQLYTRNRKKQLVFDLEEVTNKLKALTS